MKFISDAQLRRLEVLQESLNDEIIKKKDAGRELKWILEDITAQSEQREIEVREECGEGIN
ncbi:MAG: hypothetical protein RR370_00945 [Synergistaceae bacterium]